MNIITKSLNPIACNAVIVYATYVFKVSSQNEYINALNAENNFKCITYF